MTEVKLNFSKKTKTENFFFFVKKKKLKLFQNKMVVSIT